MVFTREDGDFHGRAVSFREGKERRTLHQFVGFRKPRSQTLPSPKRTAKAPENGWLEDYFPIGVPAYFQVLLLLVSGRVHPFFDLIFSPVECWKYVAQLVTSMNCFFRWEISPFKTAKSCPESSAIRVWWRGVYSRHHLHNHVLEYSNVGTIRNNWCRSNTTTNWWIA